MNYLRYCSWKISGGKLPRLHLRSNWSTFTTALSFLCSWYQIIIWLLWQNACRWWAQSSSLRIGLLWRRCEQELKAPVYKPGKEGKGARKGSGHVFRPELHDHSCCYLCSSSRYIAASNFNEFDIVNFASRLSILYEHLVSYGWWLLCYDLVCINSRNELVSWFAQALPWEVQYLT